MVKNAISDYSSTAASNTDVGGVNIDEGMSPSGVNNAIRELMSHLADLNAGTSSLGTIKVDNLQLDANTISSTDTNGNINITPNGTGSVVIDGINYPQADGTADYFLKTNGAGQLSFAQVDTASIAADAIDGTKIADDAIGSEHIADNAVGAAALNVTGNGTSGQMLTSDGDGSMTWADAPSGFSYNAVSGTTPSLDVGTYNFFNQGTTTGDTTVSFSNVPTEAQWTYTTEIGAGDAYDLSSAAYNATYSPSNPINLHGIYAKNDGTKIYGFTYGGNVAANQNIYEFTLSTAHDLSTATQTAVQNHGSSSVNLYMWAYTMSDNGQYFYGTGFAGSSAHTLQRWELSTPYDLSAGITSSGSYYHGGTVSTVYGVFMNPTGTKMYLTTGSNVYEFSMSTAYSLSGMSYTGNSLSVTGTSPNVTGGDFNADGTKMFLHDSDNKTVLRYSLSTAYDISTASYDSVSTTYTSTEGKDLVFAKDGGVYYHVVTGAADIVQFNSQGIHSLTLPASVKSTVQNTGDIGDRLTYDFWTADGGTNVYISNEEKN